MRTLSECETGTQLTIVGGDGFECILERTAQGYGNFTR